MVLYESWFFLKSSSKLAASTTYLGKLFIKLITLLLTKKEFPAIQPAPIDLHSEIMSPQSPDNWI